MRFELLGPLRIIDGDGRPVRIGGPREGKILAALLVNEGAPVSEDRLTAAVWAEDAPATARAQLSNGVAAVRAALRGGPAEVLRAGSGFRLMRHGATTDLADFDRLVGEARAAGDPGRAAGLYQAALALWRGPALDGLTAGPYLRGQAQRLEERRLRCVEDRLEADLALGRPAEVIAELAQLTREYPYRERFLLVQMLALHRAGRRGDALAVFDDARRRWAGESGLDLGAAVTDLHAALLRDDPLLGGGNDPPARTVPAVPAQLPAGIPDFVGRAAAVTAIAAALRPAGTRGVVAVTGPAGVGKTVTVLRWAQDARAAFPDGQLFVNLRGFAHDPPLRPLDALARFLRALGVAPEDVPSDADEAAAAYRTLLADRRILVVLDNARDADQVRPLLPGGAATATVVTSRDSLGGLVALDGAARLDLDMMAAEEAGELLAAVLGADRLAPETAAARDLAEACGRLPLALRIAAANLADEGRSIADYLGALRSAGPLSSLVLPGEPRRSVQAAFTLSYERLGPVARRLFRLSALIPGPDFAVATVATVADLRVAEAGEALLQLCAAHLLVRRAGGRFAFMDLLQRYAAERARREDGTGTLDRLEAYYLERVDAAARSLYAEKLRLPAVTTAPAPPLGRAEALDWLTAEHAGLVAAILDAARGDRPAAWRLADGLRGYFFMRMNTVDWLTVAEAARSSAARAGHRTGQAAAHFSLSDLHRRLGRHSASIEHVEQALRLATAAGWTEAEAVALGNLGNDYAESGRPTTAADAYERALRAGERAGRRAGTAVVLGNLGLVLFTMGRLGAAAGQLEKALTLHTELDSGYGEAVVHENLGEVYHALGRPGLAARHLDRALTMYRELGDRGAQAQASRILAEIDADAGRYDAAIARTSAALTLASATGEPRVLADTLNAAGRVRLVRGDPAVAAGHHREALRVAAGSAHHYARVEAMLGLARAEPDRAALTVVDEAIQVAAGCGFRLQEGAAYTGLAGLRLAAGDTGPAIRAARIAVDIQHETGHRMGQARALAVLARALHGDARPRRWRAAATGALEIFAAVGAAEASGMRALLGSAAEPG